MAKTGRRLAGILMPVASLPSKDGVGGFGAEAYKFVDMLAEMGMGVWQILPLHPLGYGNSPYQPFSSYAGDEIYIDLKLLEKDGYLKGDRSPFEEKRPGRVEYDRARAYKAAYLREAYGVFREKSWQDGDFQTFCAMDWVYPYAVFFALKKQNGLSCWNEWLREQQNWILDRKYDISHLEEAIGYELFVQYMFYRQWMALKAYANSRKVKILGDMPFYVGIDSADVWSCREDFLLDEKTWKPAFVAGVPPDYFSATGQRWGNPIYNWKRMEEKNFSFWLSRLRYSSTLYDIIRIDHFRAFDTYWKVPASCPTAVEGEWVEAPGYALLDEVYRQMPQIRIVAEDLGDIRPEVLTLRDHYGLLGMSVAEYNIPERDTVMENQLIYTGTHDNQTVKGWYQSMSARNRQRTRKMLAKYGHPGESVGKKMLRYVYGSCAAMAIVPLADVLGLGDEARLNLPGTVGSPNWEWRLTDWKALRTRKAFLKEVIAQSGRTAAE